MSTLRDLERRIAILEAMVQRGTVDLTDAVSGAVPEARVRYAGESVSDGEVAHLMPFPGCFVAAPAGCAVVVLDAVHDPVVVAGAAKPAALSATATNTYVSAIAGTGGVAIMDPSEGTSGVVIGSSGVTITIGTTAMPNVVVGTDGVNITGPSGTVNLMIGADGVTVTGTNVTVTGTTAVNVSAPTVSVTGTTTVNVSGTALSLIGAVAITGAVSITGTLGVSGAATAASFTPNPELPA